MIIMQSTTIACKDGITGIVAFAINTKGEEKLHLSYKHVLLLLIKPF